MLVKQTKKWKGSKWEKLVAEKKEVYGWLRKEIDDFFEKQRSLQQDDSEEEILIY